MMDDQVADLSLDTALRVLGARPRRKTLRWLLDSETGLYVGELADRLRGERTGEATATSASGREARTEATRDRRISLVHAHLPLLEGTGVVEIDEHEWVVATERANRLAPLLNAAGSFDRSRAGN